jgi:hypothetical protein
MKRSVKRVLVAGSVVALTFGLVGNALALGRIFYGGNGSTPVDSGLPRVGEIYGVNPNGELVWYRYGGSGQLDHVGKVPPWDANSGHSIGNGWAQFSRIMGCGDGVILAIRPNGDLVWYQYSGSGQSDRSGRLGWSRNSGHVIGHGWQNFGAVFCAPREGHVTSITIYAVSRNGDLHWYRYGGGGEADPSGSVGWAPNSGNIIGNGWQNFRQVFYSGGWIFAVGQTGALRWYGYAGKGEQDPSGKLGWLPNSGNVIGRGWQNFRTVVGGSNDAGGFAAVIYAVRTDGKMLWYRYTGRGEANPEGNVGWSPNSGNQIGSGW